MTKRKVDNRINIAIMIYDRANRLWLKKEETNLYFKTLNDAMDYCENNTFTLGLGEAFGLYRSGELIRVLYGNWIEDRYEDELDD